MGRRAAGALVLALLLHGRLLAVSVRAEGRGRPESALRVRPLGGAPRLRSWNSGPGRRRTPDTPDPLERRRPQG